MSQILQTGSYAGKVISTGVPQESQAHQKMESKAHQKSEGPLKIVTSIGIELGWISAWTSTSTSGPFTNTLIPEFDAIFEILGGYPFPNDGFFAYATDESIGSLGGYTDPNGQSYANPGPDPVFTWTGADAQWSGYDTTVAPPDTAYWPHGTTASPYGPDYPPDGYPVAVAGAYIFDFGASVAFAGQAWSQPGTYYGEFYISDGDPGDSTPNPANADFEATFEIGPLTIVCNRSTGISCATPGVITDNTESGSLGGGGGWTANFSYTFTSMFQISGTAGPMKAYDTTDKSSAGTAGFGVYKT